MNSQETQQNKKQRSQLGVPDFLQPFLWSYDLSQLDLEKHKNIIIKNILDFGTVQATDWLKKNYTTEEIKKSIQNSYSSDWSKKSLNFWSLIYEVTPKRKSRAELIGK